MNRISIRVLLFTGLTLSLLLAGVASAYASGHPDGLEFVARQFGFAETATDSAATASPLADYAARGVAAPRLAGAIAGAAGVLVTAAIAFGLTWQLRRRPGTSRD